MQEGIEIKKHGSFYSPIGFSFFPFIASCFGFFAPTDLARFIFALADLELRHHNKTRLCQHLDPVTDYSSCSQFRALCCPQILARIAKLRCAVFGFASTSCTSSGVSCSSWSQPPWPGGLIFSILYFFLVSPLILFTRLPLLLPTGTSILCLAGLSPSLTLARIQTLNPRYFFVNAS